MPYVPSHLRNQATATTSDAAPASNPFGSSRQTRAAPEEMPSAFTSSRRRTDDPHENPSAFAWGKPRESRDVIPLEPAKPVAVPVSEKNPKVVKGDTEDGPVFEFYANGAMSAADPVPAQAAKPSGYVAPQHRKAASAAPKTYDEMFPTLGGASAPKAPQKEMKFSAPSSAGRSWAAIAQDDSIRLEAIRKQEEERQAAYDAATSYRMDLNDIGEMLNSTTYDNHTEESYCYDYNA